MDALQGEAKKFRKRWGISSLSATTQLFFYNASTLLIFQEAMIREISNNLRKLILLLENMLVKKRLQKHSKAFVAA